MPSPLVVTNGELGGDQDSEKRDGREAGEISVALFYKLQTTMHAILVPVPSALRMFCVAAFLDDNILVYNVTTVRAEPDGGIVAPVIQILTPLPSHFGYLPPPKAVIGGELETRTRVD